MSQNTILFLVGNIPRCVSGFRSPQSAPVQPRPCVATTCLRHAADARILVWQQRLSAVQAVTPNATSEGIAGVINLQTFFECC
jgi:hypothetical protein